MTNDEIKAIRFEIERKRCINNRHFMDWWEMSMTCPRCRDSAMRYQGKIAKVDREIGDTNRPVCV